MSEKGEILPTLGAYFRDFLSRGRENLRKSVSYRSRTLSRLFVGLTGTRSFGLNGLDLRLQEQIDLDSQYYIEVGANDGVDQSNTLGLELFYGWTGLLIEPAKSTFAELEKNRSHRRNSLRRAACVSFGYRKPEVRLFFSDLMSVAVGLESTIGDPYKHVKQGERFLTDSQKLGIESVPAITLTSALEEAGAPRIIGLLALDVEGAELEVLKGIDFQRFRIRWILVEAREPAEIDSFLARYGFTMQAKLSSHDYLFRDTELCP